MTRGRYYATVMPLIAIAWVAALLIFHGGQVALIGGLVFAAAGVIGTMAIPAGGGRQRNRQRNRQR